MKTNNVRKFPFPVGYHKFHKKQVFNFQLNRWHSFGYARFEDMEEVGHKIDCFDDWKNEMELLAEKAVSENRLINAAFYYRAAEFYILQDSSEKRLLYDKFSQYFQEAFENDGIERHEVPYENGFLPAIRLPAKSDNKKGTIIIHGGFDSFIEEFYSWMRFFFDFGYEVIAFEGPGQGAARRKYGLAMTIEWEKPAKTILDHFQLTDVTWLGISMGGWLCFRAAAFEPRIKRVIASSIAYDYLKIFGAAIEKIHIFFIKYCKNLTNKMVLKSINKERGMNAWQVAQMMYVAKEKIPTNAFEKLFLQMNEANIHSDMVKQDVLILTGRNDHFIPFRAHDMQIKALTNAKSVTGRVFTKKEQAHNHCQVGNTGLALDVMVEWIKKKS